MKLPVFDLHCDTASMLFEGRKPLKANDLHIDLTRAGQLDGYCQCFACFTTTREDILRGRKPEDVFEGQLAAIMQQLRENQDVIEQAFCPEDIRRNREAGKMSALLTIEGPAGFGFDPQMLYDLHKIGFRISTLGWNEQNPLIGSHVTGGGLTDRGAEYVKTAQQLGMIVDVSHCSDEGFWDIMDLTQGPVMASHSNSRAVFDHSRNLTDEMYRQICKTGGVAGLNLYSRFLAEQADLDAACDHVLHFMDIDPKGVALGGDLDGCEVLPEGFRGIESYPALARRLLERGLTEKDIQDIFYNNAMGVMERAVRHHKR